MQKNWFQSKINITALILVLTSISESVVNLNIHKMTFQTWFAFGVGIIIMAFRTFSSGTQISGVGNKFKPQQS